jgi:hypothetical protein
LSRNNKDLRVKLRPHSFGQEEENEKKGCLMCVYAYN